MTKVIDRTIQYYTELPTIEIKTRRFVENLTVEERSFAVKAETTGEAVATIEKLKRLFK